MSRTIPITCILALISAAGALAQEQAQQQAPPARQQQADDGADATQKALKQPPVSAVATPRSVAATEAELLRLRQQLQAAVEQAGVQSPEQRKALADQLDAIASRSAELAESLAQPTQQLEARNLELNARNSLARQAQQQSDQKEAGYRVSQLRNAAWNTKRLAAPAASTLGDFWLLQADLFDINAAAPDVDARQRQVIERMARFLREQEEASEPAANRGDYGGTRRQVTRPASRALQQTRAQSPDEPEAEALHEQADSQAAARQTILRDVKLALLSLYDQQGQTTQAAALLGELEQETDNDPALRRELTHWFGHTALVGQRFEANLDLGANADTRKQATGDETQALGRATQWSSRDQLGRVVLIHFFADWYPPSVQAFAPLRAFHGEHGDAGLAILSVRLADAPGPVLAAGQPPAGKAADAVPSKSADAPTDTAKAGGAAADAASRVPWPIYDEGPGQVSLRRMFSVRSLPRFVLIDRDGTVVSIAGSLAVLDQAAALLDTDPRDDPADDARGDDDPGDDPGVRKAKQQPAP